MTENFVHINHIIKQDLDTFSFSDGRPLVSFVLLAYNQEQYIREAVEGAFGQIYSPLEIILSDDNSSDNTFEIMKQLSAQYSGPHNVRLNQNINNLGLCGHVNLIAKLCQGEIIVFAAGDDISLPERCSILLDEFIKNSHIHSIFTGSILIDEDGHEIGQRRMGKYYTKALSIEGLSNFSLGLHGATQACRKSVFDYFEPLDIKMKIEDHPIAFRAALLGCVKHIDIPTIKARAVKQSISRSLLFEKNKMQIMQKTINQHLEDIETFISKNKNTETNYFYIKIRHRLIDTLKILCLKIDWEKYPKKRLLLLIYILSSCGPLTIYRLLYRIIREKAYFLKSKYISTSL